MTKVTVEAADLETLLQATGVLKTIEGALAQRQRDPFVKPHLDFTAAHDRIATEWRNALRAENIGGTVTPWNAPLTPLELGALRAVADMVTAPAADPADPSWTAAIQTLAAKGMVQLGQSVEGVVWAGDTHPELVRVPIQKVRLTARGTARLAEEK